MGAPASRRPLVAPDPAARRRSHGSSLEPSAPAAPSYALAVLRFDAGRYDEAMELAQAVAAAEPDRARSPLLLARALANQGRLDDALAWCTKALAADRTDAGAHYLCAVLQQELGQVAQAVTALGKVIYLDQDFALAHYALGGLYRRLGKPRESARHFAIALELLTARPAEEIVPESEGLTCGRLAMTLRAAMEA